MQRIENIDICKECGGLCCKKSGCDYLVTDFESIKFDVVDKALQTGRISIVAALDFRMIKSGQLICDPLLYLRARNKNRDIIDLFSFKSGCMLHTDEGCYYDLEHRPGAGAACVPSEIGFCHTGIDYIAELNKWRPYQNIFRKLVKKYSGKSVEQKLKEDAEEVLYKIYTRDYDGIMEIEIEDMLSGIDDLKLAFPEENKKAYNRAKNILMLKRTLPIAKK